MIGTGTAILGAAAIGLGGSLFASSSANEAAERQLQATQQASAIARETGLASTAAARDAIGAGYTDATGYLRSAMTEGNKPFLPYAETGNNALSTLSKLYGLTPGGGEAFNANALESFRNSPDYQFALKEGGRALDFSNAAKGMLQSRGHLNETQAFGQGLAGQQFGNYAGRLMSLAQLGMTANAGIAGNTSSGYNNLAQFSMNRGSALGNTHLAMMAQGNQLANYAIQGGQAQASGIVGGANAINSGLSSVGNNLALWGMLNRGTGGGGGGGGGGSPLSLSPLSYGGSYASPASNPLASWNTAPTTTYGFA